MKAQMKISEKVLERARFYGIENECFIDDIKFIFEEIGGREGKRCQEVLDILEEERGGITTKDIGERIGISKANVSSIIMELRKRGETILNINNLMILSKYVNIGG